MNHRALSFPGHVTLKWACWHWMRPFAVAAFAMLAIPPRAAEEKPDAGWSAELLTQILRSETPVEPPPTRADAERVLRTYRLSHLRLGDGGRVQNVLAILGKLLPPGSSMNPDAPANSVHVLTTVAAHKAIWEYLSAVDLAEPAAPAAAAVPEEVKLALKKLAETGDQSATLLAALGAMKTDVSRQFADIDARQRQQTVRLALGGATIVVLCVGMLGWMLRRRSAMAAAVSPETSTALALAPDQIVTALTPVHDRMRSDMLGLLNEVAIKLQAQHNEQQKLVREQQQQLEDARQVLADERRQFISETGTMVVQAVERVDATTAKLARQQDKVVELVDELQKTVRELDETKDSLRDREAELEQERAKIAALSILLEEGGTLAGAARSNGHAANGSRCGGEAPAALDSSSLCTNSDPMTPAATEAKRTTNTTDPAPRFLFLPPDYPET